MTTTLYGVWEIWWDDWKLLALYTREEDAEAHANAVEAIDPLPEGYGRRLNVDRHELSEGFAGLNPSDWREPLSGAEREQTA